MSIWDQLTPEAGQRRRQWLNKQAEGLLEYVPPEMRPWLMIADELNPITSMERAGEASNRMVAPGMSGWDRMAAAGDMLSNVAGVVAPAIGAKAAGLPVANAVEEVLTGYSPMVQPFLADESGAFAGLRALTADRAAYGQAVDMASRGASRDDIWNATGWFKGVDGQWRFEIDDSAMALRRGMPDEIKMKRGNLGTGIKHTDLFAAYPDMQSMPFKPGYDMDGYVAMYEPDADAISINRIGKAWGDRAEFKSSTMHEAQHAIQQREGFAQGGNFFTTVEDEYDRISEQIGELSRGGAYNKFSTWFNSPAGRAAGQGGYRQAKLRYIAENPDDLDFQEVAALEALQADLQKRGSIDYRRLAGEVEARNVQARLKMTADQRRATPPWATQDTPDDMQILRGLLNQ